MCFWEDKRGVHRVLGGRAQGRLAREDTKRVFRPRPRSPVTAVETFQGLPGLE